MGRCPSSRRRTFASHAGELQPVPVQPGTRQVAAHSRTAGRSSQTASRPAREPGTGPTDCGAGIKTGRGAELPVPVLQRVRVVRQPDQGAPSSWAQAGIKLTLEGKSFGDVISTAATPCTPGKACPWDIANWGGGWVYAPDYYPTGEEIFATGAASNFGQYSDKTNDANIRADQHLVVAQQPCTPTRTTSRSSCRTSGSHEPPGALTEIGKNVCGVTAPEHPPQLDGRVLVLLQAGLAASSRRPLRVTDGRSPGPTTSVAAPGNRRSRLRGASSRLWVDKEPKTAQSVAC